MIRWSETAADHLEEIWNYIAGVSSEEAASAAILRIVEGSLQLEKFPHMGRAGRHEATRELVIAPYLVIYHVREGVVSLDAVLHGNRRL